MRKIYALLFVFLPLFGFSQWTIEWHSDQFQTGFQGDDVGFDYTITNDSNVSLDITWELYHDLSTSTGVWEDYMCEGIFVCWPATVRENTFTLEAGQSVDIYQHILTFPNSDSGTWVSTAKIYLDVDSAGTATEMVTTLKTGLKVDIDGVTVYIIDGDSFELQDGNYVPYDGSSTSIFEIKENESVLSQNAPNPFSSSTAIGYRLNSGEGSMRFHDLTGKLVLELPLNKQEGQIQLQGELETGMYFYSLWESGAMVDSKRMQVIR
jgi:hypothetical protein